MDRRMRSRRMISWSTTTSRVYLKKLSTRWKMFKNSKVNNRISYWAEDREDSRKLWLIMLKNLLINNKCLLPEEQETQSILKILWITTSLSRNRNMTHKKVDKVRIDRANAIIQWRGLFNRRILVSLPLPVKFTQNSSKQGTKLIVIYCHQIPAISNK